MSLRRARAIAYGAVVLLGVAALLFTRPLPPAATQPAGEILSRESEASRWRERHDTLGRGESLYSVLARGGISEVLAREAMKAAKTLDFRRIPVGMPVVVRSEQDDSLPTEIILQLAVDKLLHLRRTPQGWTGEEERLPWTTDTIVVAGTITSNLYAAMDSAAGDALPRSARYRLVEMLAEDIYEYRVDMSRDLQVGDEFRVVAQRLVGPRGITRMDTVFGATMKLSGKTVEAVRFRSAKTGGLWFDQDGRPLRSGFLRSPLRFSRITSSFGFRRHPILGTMRKHQGTDYGSPAGTPIRSIGDGVVIRAGYNGGYGNVVEIRHGNGYVSRYGHMSRFGQGIRGGVRVSREQTIGFVGSTGLSTAPHLHFEVLVKGVHRNPSQVLANVSADPLPKSERGTFAFVRGQVMALLDSPRHRYIASVEVQQAGKPASR